MFAHTLAHQDATAGGWQSSNQTADENNQTSATLLTPNPLDFHHSLEYPESTFFREFTQTADSDITKGALYLVVSLYNSLSGLPSGTVKERTSLTMLNESPFIGWLKRVGRFSESTFSGIHQQAFFTISCNRQQMTVDLYRERFIPHLLGTLGKEAKLPRLCAKKCLESMALPIFRSTRTNSCSGVKSKIVVDFTIINRALFTLSHGLRIQNPDVIGEVMSPNSIFESSG
ncbi:unnamed protein product [Dicrocoelium dendriticum]|nr:unnamed protein product [Dicrocoelium dendriticum]